MLKCVAWVTGWKALFVPGKQRNVGLEQRIQKNKISLLLVFYKETLRFGAYINEKISHGQL